MTERKRKPSASPFFFLFFLFSPFSPVFHRGASERASERSAGLEVNFLQFSLDFSVTHSHGKILGLPLFEVTGGKRRDGAGRREGHGKGEEGEGAGEEMVS